MIELGLQTNAKPDDKALMSQSLLLSGESKGKIKKEQKNKPWTNPRDIEVITPYSTGKANGIITTNNEIEKNFLLKSTMEYKKKGNKVRNEVLIGSAYFKGSPNL